MKKASITQTKNQLSALIERVKRGDTVLILDRGKPVARLEAASGLGGEAEDGLLDELERSGIIRRAEQPPDDDSPFDDPPPLPGRASALDALLEERSEGR